MKIVLFGFFLSIAHCILTGCEISHVPLGSQANSNSEISAKTPDAGTKPEYIGCWGGTRGGSVEFSNDRLINPKDKTSFALKELSAERPEKISKYLLEIDPKPSFSSMDKFLVLKVRLDMKPNETRVAWIYGFSDREKAVAAFKVNSYQPNDNGEFTGVGEFLEIPCD